MSTYVVGAKPDNVDLELSVSFLSRLFDGETILAYTSAITVHSGIDPNVASMLVGVPTRSYTNIEQLITGGVIGVIYVVWLAIRTTLGNLYVQEVKIAISEGVEYRITVLGDRRVTVDGSDRIIIRVL